MQSWRCAHHGGATGFMSFILNISSHRRLPSVPSIHPPSLPLHAPGMLTRASCNAEQQLEGGHKSSVVWSLWCRMLHVVEMYEAVLELSNWSTEQQIKVRWLAQCAQPPYCVPLLTDVQVSSSCNELCLHATTWALGMQPSCRDG